jgi:hypothetical protein
VVPALPVVPADPEVPAVPVAPPSLPPQEASHSGTSPMARYVRIEELFLRFAMVVCLRGV